MTHYPYKIPVCKNCGDMPLVSKSFKVGTIFKCTNDWRPTSRIGSMLGKNWIECNNHEQVKGN